MYRPAPVRRRKTSIVRSRSGCGTCRRRRKKCDEKKPVCGTCQKLGKRCDYETNLEFRQVSFPSSQLRSESISTPAPSGVHPAPREMTYPQRTPPKSVASSRPHLSTSDPASADFGSPQDLWIPVDDHCELVHRDLTNHTVDLLAGDCLELQNRGHMHGLSSQALIGDSYAVEQTYGLEDFSPLPISPHPGNSTSQLQGSKLSDSHRLRTAAQFNHQTVINMPDSLVFLSRQLFYLTAWQDRCSPALPPILEQFDNFESLQPVVSEAMAALSACRLSRLNPHKDHDASRQLYYRPNLSHRIASQESYCSAIKGVVSWRPLDGYPDATVILRVLLLFCCLESAMGNFRGFELHSRGVVKLAENGIESIIAVDRARGIKLLQAWAQIKMHNWWLRFHFSTQQFLSSDVGFRLEPPLQVFLPVAETRRTSILGILCESYRLSSLIHMHRWNKTELMGSATPSQDTRASLESLLSETIAGNKHALKEQSQILDIWHSLVARSDLPFDSFGYARPSIGHTYSGLDVRPLYFTSHTAAMNYAYYATARIAQSGCGAELIERSAMARNNDLGNESSTWAMLLLRIVAGIDWEECLRLNPFTIGISGLLLVCSLRCSDPDISNWIQSWIEERFIEQSSEEGSFPISQILRSLRLINKERVSGVDVVAIFTPGEDGGGRGKYDSYESQTLTVVSTICRKREDNSYTLLKRSI